MFQKKNTTWTWTCISLCGSLYPKNLVVGTFRYKDDIIIQPQMLIWMIVSGMSTKTVQNMDVMMLISNSKLYCDILLSGALSAIWIHQMYGISMCMDLYLLVAQCMDMSWQYTNLLQPVLSTPRCIGHCQTPRCQRSKPTSDSFWYQNEIRKKT